MHEGTPKGNRNEICFVTAVLLPYHGFVFLCVFVVVPKYGLLLLPFTRRGSILCTQPELDKHVMCAWIIAHPSPYLTLTIRERKL